MDRLNVLGLKGQQIDQEESIQSFSQGDSQANRSQVVMHKAGQSLLPEAVEYPNKRVDDYESIPSEELVDTNRDVWSLPRNIAAQSSAGSESSLG